MKKQPVPIPKNQPGVALLVIDIQQALFERPTPIYCADQLLDTIIALVEQAHRAGIPVFYIQHSNDTLLVKGSQGWKLHPRLSPAAHDALLHKTHGNAFEDTDLETQLDALNIGRLVITGLVTHGCVKATSLGALQLGYQVTLAADGHSSYSKDAAKLIAQWNHQLEQSGAQVRLANEIGFGSVG